MIDYLLTYGIDEDEIRNMIEINPTICSLDMDKVEQNIEVLKMISCQDRHITNIIVSNPFYLNSNPKTVMELILYLTNDLKMTSLYLVFDSNPWLLNKPKKEIEDFVELKK